MTRSNQWLFGGVERNTNGRRCFLVPVETRDAATLLPLIRQYIAPGTRILSDGWRAYNRIQQQAGQNYQHDVVIHERHFVDPNDHSTHTEYRITLEYIKKKPFKKRQWNKY